ncbi:ABC transporter permease [Corallococcus terminator]|uniref:FtsX-like permease family protein n=1 Tax=Corallococcus terminator TaxID=2316733 RepID=A0A3A8JB41_9BACT|nr:ABC transporter permease [Corallococcus terminator]RKG92116.1 FtsX-like permease family protein [Corallococcus terminator]
MNFRVDVWEGARIALSSLRSNRLRTVLTTVGIGVGVCTLLAIVGIIQGLNSSFAEQLGRLGSNTLQVAKFPWVMNGDWWEYRNRKDLTLDLVPALRNASEHVVAVAPTYFESAEVSFQERKLNSVLTLGTSPDYLMTSSIEMSAGRFLTDADVDNRSAVAVLGAEVVKVLFPGINPVGHRVLVDQRPYRIVGTMVERGTVLGQNMDMQVITPYPAFRGQFGSKRSPNLVLAVDSQDNIPVVQDRLTEALRRERNTRPGAPDDFAINRPDQLAGIYKQLTGALYGAATGVGLITLLVGGIGIMNIMLVSVRERTREIGVRRALGARKHTIILQFLMEAASVSAVGGAMGTAVGMGIAWLVNFLTPLAARVDPVTVAAGVGFSAVVGLLFGIWPAARAANLDPVEALRHD